MSLMPSVFKCHISVSSVFICTWQFVAGMLAVFYIEKATRDHKAEIDAMIGACVYV